LSAHVLDDDDEADVDHAAVHVVLHLTDGTEATLSKIFHHPTDVELGIRELMAGLEAVWG
jgi:hypothetical protein